MDLLVVGHPADRLATEIVKLTEAIGHTSAVLDVCEAARLFSINFQAGQVSVEPDLPLFLRIVSRPPIRESFDAEFQFNECLTTLWAVASFAQSLVINRPNAKGFRGQISSSNALNELRAGIEKVSIEVFSSDILSPPYSDNLQPFNNQHWYVHDVGTFRTSAWPAVPVGEGPYRARWSDCNPAFEVVVVLRQKGWRCSAIPLEHLDLVSKSIALINNLDLAFGTVMWRISHDLERATLAQVDPFPSMEQLQFVWHKLGPALMETFFQ